MVRHWLLGLLVLLPLGCVRQTIQVAEPVKPAPFQQFIAQNFDWSTVQRVVLLPLANQTEFEHVSVELQSNLAAELKRTGRFDVVLVTHEDATVHAHDVFQQGTFDELELLRLARQHDAQAVVFGNVTHYHPYSPPRVGLSLVMISPAEGVAIASADGLWDAREQTTALQARTYLAQQLSWRQGLLGMDRVLDSPDVYQRFVCQQIASSLNPPEAPQLSGFPTELMPVNHEVPGAGLSSPHDPSNPNNP